MKKSKAVDDKGVNDRHAGRTTDRESMNISKKRGYGIKKAAMKLAKEEIEQIDELSKKTLGSYVKKADADLNKDDDFSDDAFRKKANRALGIGKATMKLAKEEVEQIQELSKKTWMNYKNKASVQKAIDDGEDDKKIDRRMKFSLKAINKTK